MTSGSAGQYVVTTPGTGAFSSASDTASITVTAVANVNANLRGQMRTEIAQLHRRHGITTVYVTHDQVEAMTLADRIVALSRKGLEQFGTPATAPSGLSPYSWVRLSLNFPLVIRLTSMRLPTSG